METENGTWKLKDTPSKCNMETENRAPEIQETPFCNKKTWIFGFRSFNFRAQMSHVSYHLFGFPSLRSQFPKQRWPTKLARQLLRKHFLNLCDAGIAPTPDMAKNPLELHAQTLKAGMVNDLRLFDFYGKNSRSNRP